MPAGPDVAPAFPAPFVLCALVVSSPRVHERNAVLDVVFVLVTVAVFAVLMLALKGVEKL
jgi:hypothetical protein